MDLFEHYKESYHKENERTKTLQDSLSVPIGIVSVLSTVVTYYVFNFDYFGNKANKWLFLVLVGVAVISLFWAVWCIYNAYANRATQLLPIPSEQQQYLLDLKIYYIDKAGKTDEEAEQLALADFKIYLQNLYIQGASINKAANLSIYSFLTNCRTAILAALVVLIAASVPYGINYANKPAKSTKFEIIKSVPLGLDSNTIKSIKMAQDNKITWEGKEKGLRDTTHTTREGYPKAPSSIQVKGAKVSGGGVTQDGSGNVRVKDSK